MLIRRDYAMSDSASKIGLDDEGVFMPCVGVQVVVCGNYMSYPAYLVHMVVIGGDGNMRLSWVARRVICVAVHISRW